MSELVFQEPTTQQISTASSLFAAPFRSHRRPTSELTSAASEPAATAAQVRAPVRGGPVVRSAAAAAAASVSAADVHIAHDPELETRVKKACERISENLHICANEPSLAFYRLAEHVRKALPPTVESRLSDVRRLHSQLSGAHADAENGLESVRQMERAAPSLSNAQELLKNAIFLQQQIKYEQQKSRLKSMHQNRTRAPVK